jgi:broad specificity phosphatase PhoE
MGRMGELILVRHGETEWSATGRHTSHTDVDLTPVGVEQARALAPLHRRDWVAVISSPRRRALRTAELAGLTVTEVDPDLAEWNYGAYEGVTTAEIHKTDPDWSLWTDGAPEGETPEEIGVRVERLLTRVRPLVDSGDVALVGHGHCLRAVAAQWIGLGPGGGAVLRLDTATVSALGYEHGRPVVARWNNPVS